MKKGAVKDEEVRAEEEDKRRDSIIISAENAGNVEGVRSTAEEVSNLKREIEVLADRYKI